MIAFTAAHQGAGVSHVVHLFAEQLAAQTMRRVLVVDARQLRKLRFADVMKTPGPFVQTNMPNLWLLPNSPEDQGDETLHERGSWLDESDCGLDPLAAITATFAYTLIDCPALRLSAEAQMLAPEVDGVVLVVEADKTKRTEILRAREAIEMANGKLTALVLNKRRHVVPNWLYRML
jgi:MinD-like ATPase involved in chromosome partitioning or flagellar assembly